MSATFSRNLQKVVMSSLRKSLISIQSSSPQALKLLYRNLKVPPSRVWIYEYQLIDLQEMEETFKQHFKERGLIPFAKNIDGDFLACGKDDHSGGVYEVEEDEEEIVCESFATYLEQYRCLLLSNKLEYIEGMGMVQRSEDIKRK
mmetsp:Transcript_12071/g.15007  ORF Transcript_12071/g.15007 Transcript_12071/m.15007 type:complete len:145 (+) Transcript_12071:69-503(+)